MTEYVNKEKECPTSTPVPACTMAYQGWALRPHKLAGIEMMAISKDGVDVIIVENPGKPNQALNPVSGDFGMVALFMDDGENWLEENDMKEFSHGQGHQKWMEWKIANFETDLTVEKFFEEEMAGSFEKTTSYM